MVDIFNNEPSILFDIKGVFDRKDAEELEFIYWRL